MTTTDNANDTYGYVIGSYEDPFRYDDQMTVDVGLMSNDELRALVNNLRNKARYWNQQTADARKRAAETETRWQAQWANAEAVLHQAADDRNYCSEADDVFEQAGFNRRSRDYEVEVTVSLSVTARDADDAGEQIDVYMVRDAYNSGSYTVDVTEA